VQHDSLADPVDTVRGGRRVTRAPVADLRLNAGWHSDRRDHRTALRDFPEVTSDIHLEALPGRNTPSSQTPDRFRRVAHSSGFRPLTLSAGAGHEMRSGSYSDVMNTREDRLTAGVAGQVHDKLQLALKVAHAERRHKDYGVATWFGADDSPPLRRFN
jgi:hypothetical protein